MDIKIEKLPVNEVKLTITLTPERTAELKKTTLESFAKNVTIPGFRAGNAPLDKVEAHVGSSKVFGTLFEEHVPTLYFEAIQSEKITPLSRPNVDLISSEPLSFTAIVAVQPDIVIEDLDKIKIKKPTIKVTDKDVENNLHRLLTNYATYTKVDRKAKKGDRVEIDFEGFDDKGEIVPNTKSENHPIVLGDNMFIPGFEDNLIDLKEGDNKEFTVTFPKDYHAVELQNKPVTFKVKIKQVEDRVLPELNEELSQKIFGEKLEGDAFKAKLKADIEHEQLHEAETKQEDELFDLLLEKAKFAVSPILIEDELNALLEDLKQNTERSGIEFEAYTKMLEMKEGKPLNEIYEKQAEERVKVRFIIDHVIKEKKLEASQEDIQKIAEEKIKAAPKEVQGQVKKYYEKDEPGYNAVRNQVLLDKFFELFIERIPHKH